MHKLVSNRAENIIRRQRCLYDVEAKAANKERATETPKLKRRRRTFFTRQPRGYRARPRLRRGLSFWGTDTGPPSSWFHSPCRRAIFD